MIFFNKFLNSIKYRAKSCSQPNEAVIALAGNPNVGKSTVFNRLTGLHQHTGNWAGKTVVTAEGFFQYRGERYRVVDIPGMYSYSPHSAEELDALRFLLSGSADVVVVVCDAGCLARGISFALETAELTENIIICVNLTDEAERRGIHVDTHSLSKRLGLPVVSASAANGRGINELAKCIADAYLRGHTAKQNGFSVKYSAPIEAKLQQIKLAISDEQCDVINLKKSRFLALHLLLNDDVSSVTNASENGEAFPYEWEKIKQLATKCRTELASMGLDREKLAASVTSRRILAANAICEQCVIKDKDKNARSRLDQRLDKLFTGRISGRICMLLLLCAVFWLTITGANYPSDWLAAMFDRLEVSLRGLTETLPVPQAAKDLLMDGVYRVLTRIISVMLPPMAIFFPLFTLLEDSGYLPRAAFNLDSCLQRCGACGKQALTSCMGFGCNAVGVTGCRIIDSPRERLMAIVTNSFIPCNGRFPMLTALISMFLLGSAASPFDSLLGAMFLTGLICLGLSVSFGVSKLLSLTLLRGVPSSFTLELPPYRKPRIGSVIIRSVFDRTIFVLGRAAAVAAPAGAVIWMMSNVKVGSDSVLNICCHFLDPLGKLLGMDGVILTAFLLGLPANEIVIPLMIMAYMAQGNLTPISDLSAIHALFVSNGWTASTAICTMLFTLMHWPCATTCVTIYKETKSLKWTALSVIIPTITGCIICASVATLMRLF